MANKKGSIGKFFFERLTTDSPEAFTRICPVFAMSGLGSTNLLEDVSTFCSENEVEYIAGRRDGKSLTVEANYVGDDDDIESIIDMIEAGESDVFRVVNENVTPNRYIRMTLIGIDWEPLPSVESKNSIRFEFKRSGALERGTL